MGAAIPEKRKHTPGVGTLLGDPRKAVVKLSIPLVVAMSTQTLYNLVDAIWVSGLGASALSAVGFLFPFILMVMAIANGIGTGGGAAISRTIGAHDKEGTDRVASHTIVIMLICAVLVTLILLLFCRPLFRWMGAGTVLDLAVEYANIIFSGILFIFFVQVAVAILKSEGDAKRAMYAMGAGAVLNIVLDPIFIYGFGLGVAGAAWATVLSMLVVSTTCFYWLFLERKTHVAFKFKGFAFDGNILREIGRVAFPDSVSQMSMALMTAVLIFFVAAVGGSDGVAVYITGWRIISLAILPILGVGSALTSVSAAAFGNRNYRNIRISYLYALKVSVWVECLLVLILFLFAKPISWIFTLSNEAASISDDLTLFLKILSFSLPAVAFGMLSAALFQGVGKGINALVMTLVRTFVFTVPTVWFLGVYREGGLRGMWIGMVVAVFAYIPLAFGWALLHMRNLEKQTNP